MHQQKPLSSGWKRLLTGLGLTAFLALSLLVFWYAGRPLLKFAAEPELFRQWVDRQGIWAPVLFVGMVVLQVIVAIIPGEPLEITAGYAFGAWEGTLLCMLGAFAGSVAVFLLVRHFGTRAVEVFFPLDKLRSLPFLQDKKRLSFWVFLAFFLPGTPKDVLCYFVGLTDLPLRSWLLISAVARIPSIVTSTVGGNALGIGNYAFAAIVFSVTLLLSLLGLAAYKGICSLHEKRKNSRGEDTEGPAEDD